MKRYLGWIIGGIVVLGIGALITYGILLRQEQQLPLPFAPLASTATTERVPPPGFKEYRNATYHFSLFYPAAMNVEEFKEPGTSITVTFRSTVDDTAFQIYVTPYGKTEITSERLAQDIRSGTISDRAQATIDGKPAMAFFSSSAQGELREVWFIHHGFLYEVSTYRQLDTWLTSVLATWKFF